MEGKELSMTLRELACSQPTPLCKEWTDEWEDDTDIDGLVDKFFRGFDFCVENDYPSLDFIRENFDRGVLHKHHIYIDEKVDIRDAESGFWAFLGKCTGNIRFEGFKASTVYVRHDSRLFVKATDGAIVFVNCFDGASCTARADVYSKIHKKNRKKEQ